MHSLRWRYRAWRYRWKLERREIGLLLDHLQPGDWALDIGAHKGAYTWWMRQAVGPEGFVDAFEPQPDLAAQLGALVRRRGWNNVQVESMGMSVQPGTLPLFVPPGGPSPGASLERSGDTTDSDEVIQVSVSTVDDWVSAHGRGRLKLIKIDVEGHELDVFRGAEHTLETHAPLLLFECEARHRADGKLDAVFGHLTDRGYRGHAILRSGLLPVEAFEVSVNQRIEDRDRYANNFWFVPDGHD